MLSKITIQAIITMDKIKRGELLVQSLRVQRDYLLASGTELKKGNKKESYALQHKWLIEHRAYKTARQINSI